MATSVKWDLIDGGPASAGQDENAQWYMRCAPCGMLSAHGSREFALSRAREHTEKTHPFGDAERIKGAIIARGLESSTDDQLRAECERRGELVLMEPLERDLRAANRAAHADCDAALSEVKRITAERDEWRRRAEMYQSRMDMLEMKLGEAQDGGIADDVLRAEYVRRFGPESDAYGEMRSRALAEERHPRTDASFDYGSFYRALMRSAESGPGLAAKKPDNSIAWLDEDLLCEDA